MIKLKAIITSVLTCSTTAIPSVLAQGLVGPPTVDPRYIHQTCVGNFPTQSTTEYLPLVTVLVTLAMGIFILRARREDPPNWMGALKDLALLFGVPAILYTLWTLFVQS